MTSKETCTVVPSSDCSIFQNSENLSDAEQQALIETALALLADKHRPGQILTSPLQTRQYLRMRLADQKAELFGCLFLDSQHQMLEDCELFYGTIDAATVYPRIVVQRALENNAAAVMFYHNHCSGVTEPSHADEMITKRLQDALGLVDIRVLDHFVVSAGQSTSFAERGLL